ncbi:MAG: GntR family transcriptional regulator [Pseudomonadota bacterium]
MARGQKDSCLENLKLRILTLDLQPGSMLDEVSLAREYGLSRTPLREVIQRLAGAGYLNQKENRGAKVASMDVIAMRTFFQTAPLIYANISRLAADNRTDAQVVTLQIAQDSFAKAVQLKDAASAALANHRFHAVIGEMAHNPYLSASLDRLLIDHTRLSQTFYRPVSQEDAVLVDEACAQHDEMIRAIDAGDEKLAMELTLQHWGLSRDRMERFVKPDPLPVDVINMGFKAHAF